MKRKIAFECNTTNDTKNLNNNKKNYSTVNSSLTQRVDIELKLQTTPTSLIITNGAQL